MGVVNNPSWGVWRKPYHSEYKSWRSGQSRTAILPTFPLDVQFVLYVLRWNALNSQGNLAFIGKIGIENFQKNWQTRNACEMTWRGILSRTISWVWLTSNYGDVYPQKKKNHQRVLYPTKWYNTWVWVKFEDWNNCFWSFVSTAFSWYTPQDGQKNCRTTWSVFLCFPAKRWTSRSTTEKMYRLLLRAPVASAAIAALRRAPSQ